VAGVAKRSDNSPRLYRGRRALAQWRDSDLRLDQLQTVDALILLNQPVNAFGVPN
jgi:hypothetical protein